MAVECYPGTTLEDLWDEYIIRPEWNVYSVDWEAPEECDTYLVWCGTVESIFDMASGKEVESYDRTNQTIILK